jgi:putative transposase
MINKYHLYPTDLTDRQWELLKRLIPPATTGRPRQLDMRLVLNGMLYIVVGGVQWRMLPREYPHFQSVYYYFRKWRLDGTWQRIHHRLRKYVRRAAGRTAKPTAGRVDSQTVKAAAKRGERGYDGGKRLTGRKRHLLVDTLGLLVAVVVTAASLSDPAGARPLFGTLKGCCGKLRRVWADGAYRGTLLDWVLTHTTFELTPVERPAGSKGFVLLPRRWVVERTFAWLTQCRRLRTDYETLPESSQAMIYLAMIRLMLRRLAPA